jgi:predicted PurR-regulated permease PerM
VLGGLQVFGVLGLVVGPVIVAVTLALMDVFSEMGRPSTETLQEPTLLEEQSAVSAAAGSTST